MEFTSGQLIAAGFSALSAVIGILWKLHLTHHKEVKCDLRDARLSLTDISEKVIRIEAEREGFRFGVEKVSQEVLDELSKIQCKGE